MVMLKGPTCVNLQDRHGRTPLHAAVLGGHMHTVQCLIKHGADIDLKAESGLDSGRSPLHTAALVGETDIAVYLMKHGGCVNNQDASGHAPLHLAVLEGHAQTAGCLIDGGANCDLQDVGGKTPLHLCFDEKEGPTEIQIQIALMLVPNSNLYLTDQKGRLALHLAALWDCGDVIELMLTRDIDVNVRDSEGNTPLHYAFLNESSINMEAAKVLLGHGVDLQLGEGNRHSPIHALMKHRRSSDPEVKEMVREWATKCLPAEFGGSLLHLATVGGNTDVARFLLVCGVDPNIADNQGRCPLHLAAIGGRLDLLRVLLKNGADVEKQDSEGATALHYAAELPRVTAVKMLLREGSRTDSKDNLGQTPLHRAAGCGALDTVKHLVSIKADLNAQTDIGLQPLHFAAQEDQEVIAEYLTSKGADVHCKDKSGRTALHLASINDHCDLIKALYVNGADVNDADQHGWTALHFACFHGNPDSVQTLLNRSANATLRDNNNKQPEDIAKEQQHDDVIGTLKNFRKSFLLYAQEQLPLVTDSPEELYQKYQNRRSRHLNCLRPLVSVETLPDEEESLDVDSGQEKLQHVEECGEHVHLLQVNCISQPSQEVELEAVCDKDPKSDQVALTGRKSRCACCKIS